MWNEQKEVIITVVNLLMRIARRECWLRFQEAQMIPGQSPSWQCSLTSRDDATREVKQMTDEVDVEMICGEVGLVS